MAACLALLPGKLHHGLHWVSDINYQIISSIQTVTQDLMYYAMNIWRKKFPRIRTRTDISTSTWSFLLLFQALAFFHLPFIFISGLVFKGNENIPFYLLLHQQLHLARYSRMFRFIAVCRRSCCSTT